MNNWISVADRLPEVNELERSDCVIAYKASNSAQYTAFLWFGEFRHYHCGRPLYGVTHWQPLLEPPQ